MKELTIDYNDLTLEQLFHELDKPSFLKLSEGVAEMVRGNRDFLNEKVSASENHFYGINTGFGSLCDVKINADGLKQLQDNLILSHAAGAGEEIPDFIVRMMILLKIKSLSMGYSGISPAVLERLMDFYNYDIVPLVRRYGSLGASGDLAPLAHIALPLIGMGEVKYQGNRITAQELMDQMYWKSIDLQSKEGIALLNGTQFSTAYLVYILKHARSLLRKSLFIAGLSLDSFDCMSDPFDEKIHKIRRQKGQIWAAQQIRTILEDSEIWQTSKDYVQDPYSFRCIPQVIGASYDAWQHVAYLCQNEINAVTDNPLIFENEDQILSGGNFHAQPIALAADYLSMAMAELGSISERRSYKLLNGKRGLPEYLTPHSGLHSGYMIAQYTAASMVSHNKQLCSPSSVDSIESSNGQEDHVSMAANAVTKCMEICNNVERILSIEWMIAAQAIEFRRPKKTSSKLEEQLQQYRSVVPVLEEDRICYIDMDASLSFIKNLSA